MISTMWERTKKTFKEYPITSGIATGVSAYFLYLAFSIKTEEVSLTNFISLLEKNEIKECVVQKEWCHFSSRGIWSVVNTAMLSQDKLFSLLLTRQDIDVRSVAVDQGSLIELGLSACSLYLGYEAIQGLRGSQAPPKRPRNSKISSTK